ncbi:MAG TPA: tetratricopeptide repeat protein [Myxococcales bacterium]
MAIPFERTCFVVMPFGPKKVGDVEVDFDAIYDTVFAPAISAVPLPAPEEGRLEPRRTDKDFFSAHISQAMFEYLEYSRAVLADISGLNANVFYELGVRHRARSAGTIVFRQVNALIPFDINQIKAFPYEYTPKEKARESQELISRVLSESLAENALDSPVQIAVSAQRASSAEMQALLRDAEEAIRVRDLASAIDRFERVRRMDPSNPFVRVKLGLLFKDEERWDEALALFAEAARISPRYGDALREQGIVENQIWRKRSAGETGEAALRRAIALNPTDFDALASLGGALKRMGRPDEALQMYRKAAEVSRGHTYPLLNALKLEAQQKGSLSTAGMVAIQLRKAAASLEAQVAARPPYNAPWCFFDLAEIRLYLGDGARFLALIDEAVDHGNATQFRTFRESLEMLAAKVRLEHLEEGIAKLREVEKALG